MVREQSVTAALNMIRMMISQHEAGEKGVSNG